MQEKLNYVNLLEEIATTILSPNGRINPKLCYLTFPDKYLHEQDPRSKIIRNA